MRDLLSRARGPLFCGLFALTLDCATLEKLTLGTCGNGVLDPGEDCDGTHEGEKGKCGAPATDQSCHYTCTAKTAAEDCPAGWGCSVIGTCAGPSGAFLPARDAQSAGVRTMLAGDFNGDGRKDILGLGGLGVDNASKGRVHYAEADGELKEIIALPGLMTSPFVTDINRDGVADIVFGYYDPSIGGTGVGLLKGQRERNFVPELFTSFVVPTSKLVAATLATRGPEDVGQSNALVALTESKAEGLKLVSLGSNTTNGYEHTAAVGPDALVGNRLYVGKMFKNTTSACGEVAVVFKDNTNLKAHVYSPCTTAGPQPVNWSTSDPREYVVQNAGANVIAAAFVGDVDGDGNDDLVMTRGVNEDPAVFLSNGASLAPAKPFTLAKDTLKSATAIPFVPLAAGDLNGDGHPEIVYRFGVLVSSVEGGGGDAGPGTVRYALQPSSRQWSQARIVDLNNDGNREVVAASDTEPDVDVLEVRKTPVGTLLANFTVASRGPVNDLVILDLDFDGLPDIVILDSPSATDERFVSVAYGRLTMPPEPTRAIGRLTELQQLLVSNGGLVVSRRITTQNPLPDFAIAVVFPSSERQPIAPLLFDETAALGTHAVKSDSWRPFSIVAGPMGNAETDDLIALGIGTVQRVTEEPPRGIWFGGGTADRRFSPPREVMNLDQLGIFDNAARAFRFAMATGDLDGDKRNEVVALTDDVAKGLFARVFVVPAGGGEPQRKDIPIANRRLPNGIRFDPRIDLLDIDGDGKLDLVTLLEEKSLKAALKVDVFFGDGAASFADTPVTVTLPARKPTDPPWEPSSYAQLTTVSAERDFTGTSRKDLFIITATNLFQATLAPDRSSFSVRDVTNLLEGGLTYGTGLVAGDFDGDGVEDLAVAVDGAIRILRQKARGK